MCNCFNGGRSRGCNSLNMNEIREAIRTAEAAACAAAQSAREAEAAACNAERIARNAEKAACEAREAAQQAAACARAAEAAKDRMIYMLEQHNDGCDSDPISDCGCNHRG